ncbi:hypothetical protein UAW_02847 [Enterococcus haemoperoxidus ATCC BAA-382]|uniref:Uncharacterized protein n=1 Tax=Enterococcus haemoperoxidus ATCC BAA-382 TaxID=1158608 RepID=R2SIW1_9ENTE|nr:hypothetical protein [Enterococcus haemoperoxidus]EOH92806.1 hypothetical protein UAW_02847 [Enterococcus haemoperoxidus ATCC BAA-382]EOT61549.1 hypothetical protein I583_00531 [Enterococcus haemoperoxidus ATCC BAA-382]OJG55382.1 hypothetical protein RV06_GL001825 [Enterococcus haemoperoxidus]
MRKNEYLTLVAMEECAEIQQALSKAIRFGFDDHHPSRADETNEEQMLTEFYQLTAMIEEMQNKGIIADFPQEKIKKVKQDKIEKVYKYLDYSEKKGLLE